VHQLKLEPLDVPSIPRRHAELLNNGGRAVQIPQHRQWGVTDLCILPAFDDQGLDGRLRPEKLDQNLRLKIRVDKPFQSEFVSFQNPPLHRVTHLPLNRTTAVFEDVEVPKVEAQMKGVHYTGEVLCLEVHLGRHKEHEFAHAQGEVRTLG
jgi:hypothetical protein